MNHYLNDHSEVSNFEKEMEKISPFELKDRLIELAGESIKKMMHTMLNAGRGNPNWVATLPREAFFALGKFGIGECRRDWQRTEGLAGIPQKEGIAGRFEQFLCHIVTYSYLGVAQYAVGYRVLVAHYALGPFVDKLVGIHFVLVEHIMVAFVEELRPFLLSVLLDELLKALGNAILLWYAGNALGALPVAAALVDAEFS